MGVSPATDRVELSSQARQLSITGSLGADQIDAIRARIADGAYDRADVADAVARAILRRGDA